MEAEVRMVAHISQMKIQFLSLSTTDLILWVPKSVSHINP